MPSFGSRLSLKIFYPGAVPAGEIEEYNAAFRLWSSIWVETRREVDERLPTPSDSFSRQSEILVLCADGEPIATCCHRYVDLRHEAVLLDSYFTGQIWPDEVKAIVPGLGRSCVLGSHIFVRPDFRKSQSGLPTKELVCALCFGHVNGTRPDVLLGMVRLDKGLGRLFEAAGAHALARSASWYHIPVDLVALFPRRQPIAIAPEYRELAASVGATCDRFGVNYLETRAPIGGRIVERAEDLFV